MLHDSKSTKEPPIIKVCSEIPIDCRSENKFESIPTTSGKLTEPSFQSSLLLLKNLESLKKVQVDSNKLLKSNLSKDQNMRKLIDNKVYNSTYIIIYLLLTCQRTHCNSSLQFKGFFCCKLKSTSESVYSFASISSFTGRIGLYRNIQKTTYG